MLDETPTTDASRTLASAISPAALASVRRHRAAVAVHVHAARLRRAVLERDAAGASNAARRWQNHLEAHRDSLAMRFAARHGLHLTRHRFGPAALASNALIVTDDDGRTGGPADAWKFPEGDHIDLFERNGRAAAAVAHCYAIGTSPEQVRAACEAFAARVGLRVTFPAFPSWWFPGETVLVAYWPGVEEGMF